MEFGTRHTEFSQPREHEYYRELCAVATSGSLSDQEWNELEAHLEECDPCKELLRKYRAVVKVALPLLMAGADDKSAVARQHWSLETARQELLARIARGDTSARLCVPDRQAAEVSRGWSWRRLLPEPQMVLVWAASAVLAVALAAFAYFYGRSRGEELARGAAPRTPAETNLLDRELGNLLHQRTTLDRDLRVRTRDIENLREELRRQTAEAARWRALKDQVRSETEQQNSVIAALQAERTSLAAERDRIEHRLQEAESSLLPVQKQLDNLRQERTRELLRTASLEMRIEELTARLKEGDETMRHQEQFLASDRDIRELMGARDLYIADVFDVDREGKTQKAFGRVFYTSGKSLIFYAFDLNQQPGVRDAASFQAWGRRGPGDKRPLNMGIFYLDNEANKRWVLRFDDPKLLAQIDAVFVTVEPRGGRQKPSGRQLLFASLRTPPNHP